MFRFCSTQPYRIRHLASYQTTRERIAWKPGQDNKRSMRHDLAKRSTLRARSLLDEIAWPNNLTVRMCMQDCYQNKITLLYARSYASKSWRNRY